MLKRARLTARAFLTGVVAATVLAGILVAPVGASEDPTDGYLARAISLASEWRGDASLENVSQPSVSTFTASSGPHAGEPVDSFSWIVSDTDGAYTAAVLLYEKPWISTFQKDATGRFVGGGWELASADPQAPVARSSNQSAAVDPLACAVGAGAASGGAGAIACLPFTPVGQVICGVIGGAIGGAVGYVVCQDVTEGEGVQVDLTCYAIDRCKVNLTVRSLNNRPDIVNVDTYWDLEGQTGVIGAMPCRPACGNHSITLTSHSGAQYVSTTYIVDPDDPTRNEPLYEYKYAFTVVGAPSCFVKNTLTVWAFFRVGLQNTQRDLFTDLGARKNHEYCPF